jgi:hypothetical protein
MKRRYGTPSYEKVSNIAVALTERQINRHGDLLDQYREVCGKIQLAGRSAMVVLPGPGCRHDPNMFRPVHRVDPSFRNRPTFVILSAGEYASLTLSVTESKPHNGKLQYKVLRQHNYTLSPEVGCGFGHRLDAQQHVIMTAANNLLQELISTAEKAPGQLALPKLVLMTKRIKIDERKLKAIAENVDPALRNLFMQKRREESEIISHGQLFGDAELLYDSEIKAAFSNELAYEDYEDVLGAEQINPARKVFLAANPAMALLREAGVHKLTVGPQSDQIIAEILPKMRERLPWPELATDEDLLEALAKPTAPVNFSAKVSALPSSAIIRAMRAALPAAAALREHVTDEELLEAASDPSKPLIVHAYSKIQVFPTEALSDLPNYATGSLVEVTPAAKPAAATLELATSEPEAVQQPTDADDVSATADEPAVDESAPVSVEA